MRVRGKGIGRIDPPDSMILSISQSRTRVTLQEEDCFLTPEDSDFEFTRFIQACDIPEGAHE